MTYYTHRYTTLTEYQVVAHYDDGFSRVVDPHNEVDWIAAGNTPEKTSGDRFILIVDGEPVLDPNKDSILAAEVAAVQTEANRIAAKAQAFIDNLPSWSQVETAVKAAFPDAKQQAIMLKICRVVYWLAKDQKD